MLCVLHVSEAGCPAADATSDSGQDHRPPAPRQSARCSAERGGPAGRRSHPARRDMENDSHFHGKITFYDNKVFFVVVNMGVSFAVNSPVFVYSRGSN